MSYVAGSLAFRIVRFWDTNFPYLGASNAERRRKPYRNLLKPCILRMQVQWHGSSLCTYSNCSCFSPVKPNDF